MSRHRKTPPRSTVPASAAAIERAPSYPAWFKGAVWGGVQHSTTTIQTTVDLVVAGKLRLPKFQRSFVWHEDQIVRLFDSFMRGYHVGSMLLWERYDLPRSMERFADVEIECAAGRAHLVVDGQQRLGSIASAALSGRWFLDLQSGQLTTSGPGAWMMPASLLLDRRSIATRFRWDRAHAAEHGIREEDVYDAWEAAIIAFDHVHVSAVRLDGSDWTLARVMESFRRLNTEGTRMDLAELELALRRATEDGAP